ncbi:Large cysteine-rich periplasmic protein OmcB precursor [Planctomycetes bacterium Pan216]|uniref:Large cysteine-rich periplasmic protein OmcB n=1 Tax=Kolteria novifilia TaxID=2527975 RepID=A0A518B548_9BACT|nr:Large cysteine-rich periplasmic protein OmcB precursor [Planctomycetes bacterium Pan216]
MVDVDRSESETAEKKAAYDNRPRLGAVIRTIVAIVIVALLAIVLRTTSTIGESPLIAKGTAPVPEPSPPVEPEPKKEPKKPSPALASMPKLSALPLERNEAPRFERRDESVIQTGLEKPKAPALLKVVPPVAFTVTQPPSILRVGTPLLLVATVVDKEGKPVANAQVDWIIDRQSPAHISKVPEADDANRAGERVLPTFARTFTAATAHQVDLGKELSGVNVGIGQAWCLCESRQAGDMVLTVLVEGIENPKTRQQFLNVHWDSAVATFPKPIAAVAGNPATVTTEVRDIDKSKPLAGYTVRYTLTKSGPAHLPGHAKSIDVTTNSKGQASLPVEPAGFATGTCELSCELIGKQSSPGIVTVLQSAKTSVRWEVPKLRARAAGPSLVEVGRVATYTIAATCSQPLDGSRLRLVVGGKEIELLDGTGPERTTEGWTWTRTIKSGKPGASDVRFDILGADKLLASANAKILFAEPAVKLTQSVPAGSRVGGKLEVLSTLANVGPLPLEGLSVSQALPPGVTIEKTTPPAVVDGGLVTWKNLKLAPKQTVTMTLAARPTKTLKQQQVVTVARRGNELLATQADRLDARGYASLELDVADQRDPVEIGEEFAYRVVVRNRGNDSAKGLDLDVTMAPHLKLERVEGAIREKIEGKVLRLGPIETLAPGDRMAVDVWVTAEKAGEGRISVTLHHQTLGKNGLKVEESTLIEEETTPRPTTSPPLPPASKPPAPRRPSPVSPPPVSTDPN